MRFKFGVVCTNEPVEYVPVTVIVYAPGGVPLLPDELLLPQAIWKTKPANSIPISATAVSICVVDLRSEPKRESRDHQPNERETECEKESGTW